MTGMCSVGRVNVFSFGGDVFSSGGDVFSFQPNVFTLAGQVFSEEGERAEGRAVRRTWRKSRSPIRQALRQALRGRRDDGGVFSRSGRCVQFWGRCVQFLAECVQFRRECVHFGGRCVQFSAGRLGWGWGCGGSGCCCRAGWRGCGGFCEIRGMGGSGSRWQGLIREFGGWRYQEPREHQSISEQPMDAGSQVIKGLCYWVYDRFGAGRPRGLRRSIPW